MPLPVDVPVAGFGQAPAPSPEPGASPLLVSWPPITVPIMTFALPGWAPFKPPRPEVWSRAEPVADRCPLKLRWSRSRYAEILNQLRHGVFDSWRWWQLGLESYDWDAAAVGCMPHFLPQATPGASAANASAASASQAITPVPASLPPRPSPPSPPPYALRAPVYLADRFRQAGVILYPHQLETAWRVVTELGGRALLADEVGLGKTVEAGLILKEYQLREGLRRILILVPASLVWQWYRELLDKFGLQPILQRTTFDWHRDGVIIASLDTAKRPEHREILHSLEWDLVIVDEAHRLKNMQTHNWQLVNRLPKRYLLLLTATPVQNNLRELFSLLHLLHPGRLGTWASFRRRYLEDERTPKDPAALKELLAAVMIRHRHGPETVTLPPRYVYRIDVHLRPDERELYESVAGWVRRIYRERGRLDAHVFSLLTLERELCSSPAAAALTLARLTRVDAGDPRVITALQVLLRQGFGSKLQALVRLIRSLNRQLIVFTEYVATQAQILGALRQAGIVAFPFDGSMSPSRKEWVRRSFQQKGQVLVCTEAGGEGINFQFCNTLINYDLPWNPMRVEQRIGRLHRLGQTRPVEIYNLVTTGTIEEHIFYLLHEKIRLFQSVVGELGGILGDPSGLKEFQGSLMRILVDWPGAQEGRRMLDELAQSLLEAGRQRQREQHPILQI
ncbi:MAG: DEAD/DEAH box helicase [Limnochordales bacterium]|nr:DEAD/DEAH box helicase [Limnochordales bacterium]